MPPRSLSSVFGFGIALLATVMAHGAPDGGQIISWGNTQFGPGMPPKPSLLSATQLACGEGHCLVRLQDGSLQSWGSNWYNQREIPAGIGPVLQVACGARHSIALRTDRSVVCWGGEGYNWDEHPPLGEVIQIVGLERSTMALNAEGRVFVWGSLGTNGTLEVPTDLGPIAKVAGSWGHAIALGRDGSVRCWGDNTFAQCNVPTDLAGCKDVSASDRETIALRTDGSIAMWGMPAWAPGNANGATAVASGRNTHMALMPSGEVVYWGRFNGPTSPVITDAASIAAGSDFGGVVRRDGTLVVWGENSDGQCELPKRVGRIRRIAVGLEHGAAIRGDGSIVEWGRDIQNGGVSLPPNISDFTELAAGWWHFAAVRADGSVVSWGRGNTTVPEGLPPIAQVACGYAHTLARTADGQVFAWGDAYYGATSIPKSIGVVVDIDAGDTYSLACRADGTVVGWGYSQWGAASPPALWRPAVDVAAGIWHALALLDDGSVTSWGYYNVPPPDPGPFAAIACSSTAMHSVALRTDGVVVCWGENDYGQCNTPPNITGAVSIAACRAATYVQIDPSRSACDGGTEPCLISLASNAGDWSDVQSWSWNGCGPQVPGIESDVDLGSFGCVGTTCGAVAGTLRLRSGSTLLVPVDLSLAASHEPIEVADTAFLGGRVWLLATGAAQLPLDLDVPILRANAVQGGFDLVETTVPAPDGYFLTIATIPDGRGGLECRLRLAALAPVSPVIPEDPGSLAGRAIDSVLIDVNHDGLDDVAVAISFGSETTGRLQVLLNDGHGGFGQSSLLIAVSPSPTAIAGGDLNADGYADIAVLSQAAATVTVYHGNADGGLDEGSSASLSMRPVALVITNAIESKSGLPTLACILHEPNALSGSVSLRRVPSLTEFAACSLPFVPTVAAATSERLLVCGRGNAGGLVTSIDTSDAGQLEVNTIKLIPGVPVGIDVADIDGDSREDIVTANEDPEALGAGTQSPVLVLIRQGIDGFADPVPIAPSGSAAGIDVALVDIDADGDRDIVSVHRTGSATSAARTLRVDLAAEGSALSLEEETEISSTRPTAVLRGNLDGILGEDFMIIDSGMTQTLVGESAGMVRPMLGGGALPPACPGDMDASGTVDAGDLAALLGNWGGSGIGDVDRSGTVDGSDLAAMLGSWGPCDSFR
jgi:alpha-tubulin suppressor-like RCC1 family protein